MKNEIVSVIIINWNGKNWLKRCLDSITSQSYKKNEIIVVDNASSDGSVEFIKKHYPEVITITCDDNRGFAGGNNLALTHAQGEYILLLNNDTWVESDFIEKFMTVFKEIPNVACAQSKLVLMDEPSKLDSAGSFWTNSTFLYHYGNGKKATNEKYNKPFPVFSNKGAAIIIRSDVIKKIGLFDDDFWCYYEETDFCNRLWLSGYECWYFPNAVAYHAQGGTSLSFANDLIQFHNFKNKLLSFLKNFEIKTLIVVLPTYLILNIGLSFVWVFSMKPKHALALYKSIWWNIMEIKQTSIKRSAIQKMREKSDRKIFEKVKKNPRISYYRHLLQGTISAYEDKL